MSIYQNKLTYDPIPPLLESGIEPVIYFVQRDLLHEKVLPISSLWNLSEPAKIIKKQRSDGSWKYPGNQKDVYPDVRYDLLETFKQTGILIEKYGFTKEHHGIGKASQFLFSFQTSEGDFRGLLANQYMPYYHGMIVERLIKAGYESDPRIKKGFDWLIKMRQTDGGWALPLQSSGCSWDQITYLSSHDAEPVKPDFSKPFSHSITGMAIRAFAAHPKYCKTKEARKAAELLKSRFFKPDIYSSYKDASYWVRFQYPFWWNNLLAAVDSCLRIGIPKSDPDLALALNWFIENQQNNGTWKLSYKKPEKVKKESKRDFEERFWVSLAVCRILYEL